MPSLQLYDKLLQFPMFQGMSHEDLLQLVAHTKFDFSKHAAGKCVVKEGSVCNQLHFLVNGHLLVETRSDDNAYRVVEQLQAPYALQPEALFGLTQRYSHTFTAATDTNFISISKEEVMKLLEDFFIFRLNMLGIYATQSQKLLHQSWRRHPESLRERVVRFFVSHCVYPAGAKTFYILMTRLAAEVNDSRLDVSRVLNQLQAEGHVSLHRGRIEIPLLERMLM